MVRDPQALEDFLTQNPHAWPVRMALVEEFIFMGKTHDAQQLIRNSPADCQMPDGYPQRIHTLMTKGKAGLDLLEPLPGIVEN